MDTTTNYGLKKPDADDFYDVQVQNDNMDSIDSKMKEIEDAADPSTMQNHVADKENPHDVTKAQIGLSNVPNVSTNNQTPTYTVPSTLQTLESGEKLSVAMGKLAKNVAATIQQQFESLVNSEGSKTITIYNVHEKEFFAEFFAEYVMSDKPREAAKIFGEIIEIALGR